jgi:hypothetical protein
MLQALARFAIAAPKRVIVAALLMMVAAGVFAMPVMDSLSAGGMRNSASQSWYASKILADKFDQGDMQLIVSVSSDAGAQGVSGLPLLAYGADSPAKKVIELISVVC